MTWISLVQYIIWLRVICVFVTREKGQKRLPEKVISVTTIQIHHVCLWHFLIDVWVAFSVCYHIYLCAFGQTVLTHNDFDPQCIGILTLLVSFSLIYSNNSLMLYLTWNPGNGYYYVFVAANRLISLVSKSEVPLLVSQLNFIWRWILSSANTHLEHLCLW